MSKSFGLDELAGVNSSFSKVTPGLQLAVDSTSLGAFKECGRKYYYSIIQGYVPRAESVHLIFGLLYHAALERYDHARSAGQGHEEALDTCLDWTLRATWNKELQRPWLSDDANKNRMTLVRTVVWYLDQYGADDPLKTVQLANGKPAVELSFSFRLGQFTEQGEEYQLSGHMDRVVELAGNEYVLDRKTTKQTISPRFFQEFSPHNQFSLYTVAGKVAFHKPIKGLIVDAAQVAVTFSRFERQLVQRDDAQNAEWLVDLGYWLRQMEEYAKREYWPMNDKSCSMYGGCPYRGICAKSPDSRQQWLDSDFQRRIWNPLEKRGDI